MTRFFRLASWKNALSQKSRPAKRRQLPQSCAGQAEILEERKLLSATANDSAQDQPGYRLEDGVLYITGTDNVDWVTEYEKKDGAKFLDIGLGCQGSGYLSYSVSMDGISKVVVDLKGGDDSVNFWIVGVGTIEGVGRYDLGWGLAHAFDNAGVETIVHGGEGDDTLIGGCGNNMLDGGDGDDIIIGGSGADVINGGSGDDGIQNDYGGNDTVCGDDGNDTIYSATGDGSLNGGDGDDYLIIGFGHDKDGHTTLPIGNNTLVGGDGNDTLVGGMGNDELFGGDGDDHLYGCNGNDQLYGDAGNDSLEGGFGADPLFGGSGNDVLTGCGFIDPSYGYFGGSDEANRFDGGEGDDSLEEVKAGDTLVGESGELTVVPEGITQADGGVPPVQGEVIAVDGDVPPNEDEALNALADRQSANRFDSSLFAPTEQLGTQLGSNSDQCADEQTTMADGEGGDTEALFHVFSQPSLILEDLMA